MFTEGIKIGILKDREGEYIKIKDRLTKVKIIDVHTDR